MSFTIACTTCRSRLRVQDESVIGQIVACPKCRSMVLIERPAELESSTPRPSVGDSSTHPSDPPTRSPMGGLLDGDVDEVLSGTASQEADTVDATSAAEQSGDAAPLRPPPLSPGHHDDESPTDVSGRGDWLSDESRQLKRWGVIGGAGVTAVITLIILLGFALTRKPSGTEAIAEGGRPREARDAAGKLNAHESTDDRKSEPPAENSESDSSGESGNPETLPGEPSSQRDQDPKPGQSEAESELKVEPLVSDSETSERPPGGEADSPDETTAESLPEASEGSSLEGGGRTLRLPPGLRDFEDLLEPQPFESTLLLTDSPFDLIPFPGAPYDLGLAMPKPPSRQVNVTAQLGVRIPEVRLTEMPLLSFVRFISEFTTIPITLDIDTLYRMGISVDTPLRLEATNQELGQILRTALEPLQLHYRIVDSQIVISAQVEEELRELTYAVLDLTGDTPEGNASLESMLTSLIAPGTWQARGGSGKLAAREGELTVNQTLEVHSQIQTYCQQLRLARGLRLQGGAPPPHGGLELRIASALPRLEQPLDANFAIPTLLVSILDQLGAQAEVAFVIDWRSLLKLGWSPDSMARIELVDESLSSVLQELLGPMQLTFRVIDATTLQVTTTDVAAQTLEFGFFPLQDLMEKDAGQQILTGVRGALGDALALERAGGGMRFDDPSQTLIINAPQYQLAAVARQLDQLRLQLK